ncbi:hypothetical protein ACQ4PT_062360 [Festuca glaucescens]
MGDRGGGRGGAGGGGRGVGPGGGGRGAPVGGPGGGRFGGARNHVWQRDLQEGSSQNSSSVGGGQRTSDEHRDAAVQGGRGNQVANRQVPPNRPVRSEGRDDPSPCANCNVAGHLTACCPTIRCARCGKLGHMSSICQVLLPWQCVASMCGFQSPGQGFFYFPNSSSPQQVKEKASTVIITVKEGNVLARDIEKEFNEGGFFGPGWRCTARSLSPMQFSMRFPSQKEVERACCWGNELKMRTKNAILKLSPWSDDVGASSKLQKAWVRVRNIPHEKRNEAHAAYAGSLVGVTLDIDKSTLHCPEYVRILIGCRDISKIPDRAEGCLGDNFYWFYYEVDKVVVGGQPRNNSMIPVDSSSGAPSPKRARTENTTTCESSEEQTGGQQRSGSTSYIKTYASTLEVVSEHESEDENEGEGDLLIEEIIRDKIAEIDSNVMNPMGDTAAHPTETSVIPSEGDVIDIPEHSVIPEEQVTETQDKMSKEQNGMNSLHVAERKKCDMVVAEKVVVSNESYHEKAMVVHNGGSKWMGGCAMAPGTPITNKEIYLSDVHPKMIQSILSPYCQSLSKEIWPHLPNVVEVECQHNSPLPNSAMYFVQSPGESPLNELTDSHGEEEKSEGVFGVAEMVEPVGRFSKRNLETANVDVLVRATNVYKKCNLQGLQAEGVKG